MTPLPEEIAVGYWQNLRNDQASSIKLRDEVHTEHNVVNVSLVEASREENHSNTTVQKYFMSLTAGADQIQAGNQLDDSQAANRLIAPASYQDFPERLFIPTEPQALTST